MLEWVINLSLVTHYLFSLSHISSHNTSSYVCYIFVCYLLIWISLNHFFLFIYANDFVDWLLTLNSICYLVLSDYQIYWGMNYKYWCLHSVEYFEVFANYKIHSGFTRLSVDFLFCYEWRDAINYFHSNVFFSLRWNMQLASIKVFIQYWFQHMVRPVQYILLL